MPDPAGLPEEAVRAAAEAAADACRDIVHETPASQCSMASDTCPDWPLAHKLADAALTAALPHLRDAIAADALREAADDLGRCVKCGEAHQPIERRGVQPPSRAGKYAPSWAHPDDGHAYELHWLGRTGAVSDWLRDRAARIARGPQTGHTEPADKPDDTAGGDPKPLPHKQNQPD